MQYILGMALIFLNYYTHWKLKTILYLTAIENLKEKASDFKELYNSNLELSQKLEKVKALMNLGQVREEIATMKDAYLESALASLEKIEGGRESGINELKKMANYIITRHQ